MDIAPCLPSPIRYDVLDDAGWVTVHACCTAHALEAARAVRRYMLEELHISVPDAITSASSSAGS